MNKKILVRIICIVASFIIVIPLSAYFLLKDEDIPEVSPQGEIIKDEPSDTLQIALTNSDEN